MKKLLIIALLVWSCEGFGVFKHEHEGVCVKAVYIAHNTKYTCYDAWDEDHCLFYERYNNDDDIVYAWFYLTCEDYCDKTTKSCTTNSEEP